MINSIKKTVILMSWVCMTACTTIQSMPITKDSAPSQRPELSAKEEVTVVLASGEQLSLQVTESDAEFLAGVAKPSGESKRIAWSDIVRVDQRKPAPWKTMLLVVGVLVVLGLAIGNSLGHSIASAASH